MPINITDEFQPSDGIHGFDLYDPQDIKAGNINVVLQTVAGGSVKGGTHATAPVGEIAVQVKTTTGAPNHTASLGTLCWNSIDLILYSNNNGTTGWTAVGSGSSSSSSSTSSSVPGRDGEDGDQGWPGLTGAAGATGSTGPAGATGPIGPPGVEGDDGSDGFPGPIGSQGPAGVAGSPGATGQIGPIGPPGIDGDEAVIWPMGISSGALGQGTLNTIAKWTPDGFTLGNSGLIDDGTTIKPLVSGGRLLGNSSFEFASVWAPNHADANQVYLTGSSSFIAIDAISGLTSNLFFSVGLDGTTTLGGDTLAASLRFLEPAGTNYTAIKAGVQSADLTYTLPTTTPTANQVLASSGGVSSTLSWITSASGTGTVGPPGRDGDDGDSSWPIGISTSQFPTSTGIGGSGTSGKIPKFTASTTLGNSLIADDGTYVNIGQTGSTNGSLAVIGLITSENPSAGFRLSPGGGFFYTLTANGGLGSVTRTESVPILAAAVNGAVLTSTTAGQQSWTSVLPVANGGTGTSAGLTGLMGPPGRDGDDGDYPWFIGQPWSSVLNVGGVDVSLPGGLIRSEVSATTALGMVFQTKSNTGAFVNRMTIASGQTGPLTQLNFNSCGIVNFNSAALGGLASASPNTGGTGSLGTLVGGGTSAWGTAYIVDIVGGDDFNGSDFRLRTTDGAGIGTPVTVMTIPLTAAPQTATFAPNMAFTRKLTTYSAVTTAGWGVPAVYAAGRVTAQTAANASISTYTVGAADGSFEVSANMNVTASTVLSTTLTCSYTDESNTARVMTFPVIALNGTFVAGGTISGAGASVWETPVMHIRCKASTAITIKTTAGTFTGITYTAEGIIKQTA